MPIPALRMILLLALSLPGAAADPKLLSLVPGDAEAVIGVDFRAVMRSGVTQELMRTATNTNTAEFDEMVALTGIDPRTDIHEMVAAGFATPTGAKAKGEASGIVFATGNFNAERIAAAIATKGGKKSLYKGRTLWAPPKSATAGTAGVVTFLEGNVVLAGDDLRVKRYLDGTSPMASTLRSRLDDVSSRYDLWMVSAVSPRAIADSMSNKQANLEQAAGALQGDMFKKIESMQGGLKFGPQTVMGLEMLASSPEDATALVNVMRFFQSMMAGGGETGAGGKGEMPAAMKSALSAVRLSAQGSTVTVRLSLAEAAVIDFLKKATIKPATQAEAEPAARPRPTPKQEEIIIIQ